MGIYDGLIRKTSYKSLSIYGGTMEGDINMDKYLIYELKEAPDGDTEAVSKKYVDNQNSTLNNRVSWLQNYLLGKYLDDFLYENASWYYDMVFLIKFKKCR